MRSFKSTLLCVSVLSILSSCAQEKQLKEMHDNTAEMNHTTGEMNSKTGKMDEKLGEMKKSTDTMGATTKELGEKMARMETLTGRMEEKLGAMKTSTESMQQTTEAMKQTTEKMSLTTGELYDASKQGGGASIRREAFDRMLESASLGKKIDQAAQYYMALEFQLWSGLGQDDGARRLELMNDAAMEYFKAVQEVMEFTKVLDGSLDIRPLAGQSFQGRNSADNHAATLNALAAAMHLLNRKQLVALKSHPDIKSVSVYSMIKDGLAKQRALNEGSLKVEDLPGYEQEVLENHDIAVKLLQARYNVLLAIFLEKTRPKGGMNLQTYLAASKTSLIGRMFKLSWKLEMDRLNPVQVEKFRQYIDWAIETREFLKSIGETPVLDPAIASMMNSIELVAPKQPTALAVDAQVKLRESIDRINANTIAPVAPVAEGAKVNSAPSAAAPQVETAPSVPAPATEVVDPYEVSTINTGLEAKKPEIPTADEQLPKPLPTIAQRWKKSMSRTWDKLWTNPPTTAASSADGSAEKTELVGP